MVVTVFPGVLRTPEHKCRRDLCQSLSSQWFLFYCLLSEGRWNLCRTSVKSWTSNVQDRSRERTHRTQCLCAEGARSSWWFLWLIWTFIKSLSPSAYLTQRTPPWRSHRPWTPVPVPLHTSCKPWGERSFLNTCSLSRWDSPPSPETHTVQEFWKSTSHPSRDGLPLLKNPQSNTLSLFKDEKSGPRLVPGAVRILFQSMAWPLTFLEKPHPKRAQSQPSELKTVPLMEAGRGGYL